MITWHIMFDQGMWKWGRSVGHKTFFCKKPYLYQAGVDMVFSILLFFLIHFLVQSFSDHLGHHVWPRNVKRRSLSGSQNFFLQKTISIPGRCRYGFLNFLSLFNTSFLVQSFSDHLGHHVWPSNVKRRSLSGSHNSDIHLASQKRNPASNKWETLLNNMDKGSLMKQKLCLTMMAT